MNYYSHFNKTEAERLIRQALKEDIGKGDVTSNLLIPEKSVSKAELLIKENGIIAGLNIFRTVFSILDKSIKINFYKKEGEAVYKNDIAGIVKGNTRKLLAGERVALNILQRMSGIATMTAKITQRLNNPSIKIIDTRKTTPNFRLFEKLAVTAGGGENHRFGLYDMILIKDNHIEANGGISNTLRILKRKYRSVKCRVEIEVKNISELKIVLTEGIGIVDRIMLDNFSKKDITIAAKLNNGLFELELSGGISFKNVNKFSNLKGVNYISSGSLTHSVNSLDISFNFIT